MKRYTCYVDHCGVDHFHEEPDGEWVRWEDAAALQTAIDQARGLLDSAAGVVQWQGWHDDYRAWLRAHPEPATPAATGAEPRCKRCGMLQSECDLQRIETPDPFESAEKERGT